MLPKILCQINQEILKASQNNRNSSKAFQLRCPYLARICWGHSTGFVIYNFVIQVISEKTLCSKGFASNLRDIFTWKYRNYNSYKFIFILWIGFHQVGGLVTRNISAFCLSRTLLQSHTEFNRLIKRNFLTCYSCTYYRSMLEVFNFRGP